MQLAIDRLTRDKIFSHRLLKNSDLDPYLKWTPFKFWLHYGKSKPYINKKSHATHGSVI